MSTSVDLNLLRAFQQERDVIWFQQQFFPVACDVPKAREPEFGILLNRMETAHAIQEHILSNPYMHEIGNPIPHNGFLVSLPQDTVDQHGYPTRLMEQFGLESRRRFNYNPHTGISRYDVSFKSAGKGVDRNEWEADSTGFNNGLIEATEKVAKDHPEIGIVDPNSYRVSGTCVAARSSSYLMEMLPDMSACIKWEINDDPCAISTPHADILIGYRKEKELEIKTIYFPKGDRVNETRINRAIDHGLNELKNIVMHGTYGEDICFATESKGAHTVRLVKDFYEEYGPPGRSFADGRDLALTQNIEAQEFLKKYNLLTRLAEKIPSSYFVSKAGIMTSYNGYFPTRTESPKNENAFPIRKMG